MKPTIHQEQAIKCNSRELLLVASAGSGKTFVLIEKVIYLINQGVNPETILLVSFSNKTCKEIKKRLIKNLGNIAKKITVATFHSLALRIIRENIEISELNPFFNIITDDKVNGFITTICNSLFESNFDKNYYRKLYIRNIEYYLLNPSLMPNEIKEIRTKLKEKIKFLNSIEIDEIIPLAISLLEKHSEVKSEITDRYQYIMIDEYQDINEQQIRFMNLIREKAKQFVAVGDDDQCIYEWRGSRPDEMVEYSKKENVTKIYLMDNFRSRKNIIDLANSIIKNNSKRISKKMNSNADTIGYVKYNAFENEIEQTAYIGSKVLKYVEKTSLPLNEIAILVRNEKQSIAIVNQFLKLKIPYVNHCFFELKENWLINYIKCLSQEELPLERIINFPEPLLDNLDFLDICEKNNIPTDNIALAIKQIYNGKIDFEKRDLFNSRCDLAIGLHANKDLDVLGIIDAIYNGFLLSGDYFEDKDALNFLFVTDLARELINVNDDYSLKDFCNKYDSVIEELHSKNENGVNIMTIHKSKGLEFEIVFIPGIQNGVFPNSFCDTDDDFEAERRLLYVGVTRAKKDLFLTSSNNEPSSMNYDFRTEISSFMNEQPAIEENVNRFEKNIFKENQNIYKDAMLNSLIEKWNSEKNHPKLTRTFNDFFKQVNSIMETYDRNDNPILNDALATRSFLSNQIKLIFDWMFNKKRGKIADYLLPLDTTSTLKSLELHDKMIKTNKISKNFTVSHLGNMRRFKKYTDCLHHLAEVDKNKTRALENKKFVAEYNNYKNDIKYDLIKSYIVFLNEIKIDLNLLNSIEEFLK